MVTWTSTGSPDFSANSEENPQDIKLGETFAARVVNAVMAGARPEYLPVILALGAILLVVALAVNAVARSAAGARAVGHRRRAGRGPLRDGRRLRVWSLRA